jgi:hypothetical protein
MSSEDITGSACNSGGSGALFESLAAHWRCGELGGREAGDSSGNGHAGVLSGGCAWVAGPAGKAALAFDGVDGHVLVGSRPGLDLPEEMSAFAWLLFRNASPGGFGQCVYGQTEPTGHGGQYELCVGRGKDVREVTVLWNDVEVCVSRAALIEGQWYHIGFTRSGMRGNWSCRVYVDGRSSGEAGGISADPGAALPFAIGRAGLYDGLYFAGAICDLRLYRRALLDVQVAALFQEDRQARLKLIACP